LRRPDLGRVVLDPSRPGIDLSEFLLRDGADRSAAVEKNRPGARRALIQGEDKGRGVAGAGRHRLSDIASPRKMARFAATYSSLSSSRYESRRIA
jgi:hypothetical protein